MIRPEYWFRFGRWTGVALLGLNFFEAFQYHCGFLLEVLPLLGGWFRYLVTSNLLFLIGLDCGIWFFNFIAPPFACFLSSLAFLVLLVGSFALKELL